MQDSLLKHLAAEISHSKKLLVILEQENTALQTPNSNQLTTLADDKQQLLKQLEIELTAQDQLLTSKGLQAGKVGIEKIIQHIGDNSSVAHQWKELQTLTHACKDLNEVNGGIVAATRRHIEQSLDILRGSTGTDRLYGAQGKTRSAGQSNVIGKA